MLTEETVLRIHTMFGEDDRETVAALLETECGNNLPFLEDADPVLLERWRFAALKLSKGDIDLLLDALKFAQADWRDLLVAADFGNDVNAHKSWFPSTLEKRR